MSGLDIVMVIAVILFARLGARLFFRYQKMKKNNTKDTSKKE